MFYFNFSIEVTHSFQDGCIHRNAGETNTWCILIPCSLIPSPVRQVRNNPVSFIRESLEKSCGPPHLFGRSLGMFRFLHLSSSNATINCPGTTNVSPLSISFLFHPPPYSLELLMDKQSTELSLAAPYGALFVSKLENYHDI